MGKVLAVVLSVCAALFVAGQPASAGTYYVRNTNPGPQDGLTWGSAWTSLQTAMDNLPYSVANVVNAEASTGLQSYGVANRTFDSGSPLTVDFEGGWINVDTSPTQDPLSRSLIKGAGTAPGLLLTTNYPSAASHGNAKTVTVNRFDVTNVTDGIRVYNGPNSDGAPILLTVTNANITSKAHGIYASYARQGQCKLILDNAVISAGNSGAAYGIYLDGGQNGTTITNADITSAGGKGICINVRPLVDPFYYSYGHTTTIRDTVVHDCSGDGIYQADVPGGSNGYPYNSGSSVTLDRVKSQNNGGRGVYVSMNTQSGYGMLSMTANLTNVLVADNGGYGVQLDGIPDAYGALMAANVVNSTLANAGNHVLYLVSNGAAGNSATLRNTIVYDTNNNGVVVQDGSADGPGITESNNDFYLFDGQTTYALTRVGTNGTTYPALSVGDIVLDPLFSGGGVYTLLPGSPCIDWASQTYAPDVDIRNIGRPIDWSSAANLLGGEGDDIGAYEMEEPPVPEPGVLGLTLLGLPLALRRRRA